MLHKIKLLTVFYKSTLTLSICFGAMAAVFGLFSPPPYAVRIFAISFMTGGTALSLLYKETTLKNEYYFYYNQAISKTTLILTCALVNVVVGAILIIISLYA